MEKIKRWIKNNLIFFVSLIILFISIIFSFVIFNTFRIQSDLESTRVGHVYLGSDENNYNTQLNQSISNFISEADYNITYQNVNHSLDFSYFDFLVSETINNVSQNQNNLAYFSINDINAFRLALETHFNEDVINSISLNQLVSDIEETLAELVYFSTFNLNDYFNETSQNLVLLESDYTINNQQVINDLSEITTINISALKQFSLLDKLSDDNLNNETLSFLASMIQHLTLESHFTNYLFQSYYVLPTWADTNMNVKVLSTNDFDFSFYNPFNQSYQFEINVIDSTTVRLKLLGLPYINTYSIQEVITPVPYETIFVDDPDLDDIAYKVNETDTEIFYQRVLESGENGTVHQFVRTITTNSGETTMIIFYTNIDSSPEIISENVVLKAGG